MADAQPIEFPCPACGKPLRTPAVHAGRQVRCRHANCGRVVTVPAMLSLDDSDEPPPPPRRPRSRPRDDEDDVRAEPSRNARRSPSRRPPDDNEDDDPEPRARPPVALLAAIAAGVILVLGLGFGGFFLYRSTRPRPVESVDVAAAPAAPATNPAPPATSARPAEGKPPAPRPPRRDPAAAFTRPELVGLLKGAGFEVSEFGLISNGQTVGGDVLLSSSEVECVHKASTGKLELRSSSTTVVATRVTTVTLAVSAPRSPATEAAFKSFAEHVHPSVADTYARALAPAAGATGGESAGAVRVQVTATEITFTFRAAAPKN